VVSDDLKLERLFDASPGVVFGGFTGLQAPKEHYADAPGSIVESECGLRVGARAWDEFAGGCPSILHGPGRAVAARVTDRS
jgi:hypothetical protein